MASTAILHLSNPSPTSFNLSWKPLLPISFRQPIKRTTTTIKAKASATTTTTIPPSPSTKTKSWQWKFNNNNVNIYLEQHENNQQETTTTNTTKDILMIPTISDVSTVEEWRSVAKDIVGRRGNGSVSYKATIVDWPGLGYSDRPKLDYNADVMEKFLVDFVTSPDSPVSSARGV